ncbi:hypothetical protein HHK36_033174 [Tetracentron sinense]|uniref:Dirigent protein n=1 Tax=Tetracentron sinense TaxID=13715 RepID=A0A834Y6H3_TETSI|nr:hypothetical protein HHK36_033174 [Tetracentron sinense]
MAPSTPVSMAAKLSLLLILVAVLVIGSEAISKGRKLKETKMVFYMHDYETGTNISAIPVAGNPLKKWFILEFGTIIAIDDAATVAIERNSTQIARLQGMYVNSAKDGTDLHWLVSIVFTNKAYNGSTLEIQGANREFQKYREVSVVSGTGLFRFARGYATLETVLLDLDNLNAIVSSGPIRFLVNEEELVASVINTALKSYARQGRLPVLGSDLNNFHLYCSNAGFDGSEAISKGRKLKETKMVFYMHDYETGTNISAIPVAGNPLKKWFVLEFGTIIAIDDAATVAIERNSTQIARLQGMYVNSAKDGTDLHWLVSIVFTNKAYNGSTLEIQGANREFQKYREVSVVSGTGLFRFARGYATLETVLLDLDNLNAIVRWNLTVLHY